MEHKFSNLRLKCNLLVINLKQLVYDCHNYDVRIEAIPYLRPILSNYKLFYNSPIT